eukprot:CAMPEP_0170470244 /NCGR_PEP_ID=MMETSP0123-20130129/12765_1 /TAXON_ID=182087 /ORGANISM="Favella ehrenbergii, Strain Fehren 1" /LENGTH=95 /DNA_ID=CAMNT_0010737301 /DNA_START=269 /DNA_END=556 /DNA_ORIENTATION=-
MNQSHDDLMQKLAKYEDLRIKNEMQGLTSMVKNACRRMSFADEAAWRVCHEAQLADQAQHNRKLASNERDIDDLLARFKHVKGIDLDLKACYRGR